jgi:hypothetical protein
MAVLRRGPSTDQGTFGVLRFGKTTCRSLELPWRANVRQRSCIPPGSYSCAIVQSRRFGRVYHVQDVPGRDAVLMHPANLAGDLELGWTSQLQGCIAPCQQLGAMRNNAGVMQAAGLVSRPAVSALMSWADGRPFTLEISS